MLTNYKNKVMTPNIKGGKPCLVCDEREWKKIVRNSKSFNVCRGCGHVKELK